VRASHCTNSDEYNHSIENEKPKDETHQIKLKSKKLSTPNKTHCQIDVRDDLRPPVRVVGQLLSGLPHFRGLADCVIILRVRIFHEVTQFLLSCGHSVIYYLFNLVWGPSNLAMN
jgi:hypothetical protein